MSRDRETYLKFKPMADDLRKAESWCESDGVLNRNKTMQNLYKMGYRKQEWISVDERLPDKEGPYLVLIVDYLEEERMEVMELFKWANCFDWSAHMSSRWKDSNTITHWMPLPEAPKMRGGAE